MHSGGKLGVENIERSADLLLIPRIRAIPGVRTA